MVEIVGRSPGQQNVTLSEDDFRELLADGVVEDGNITVAVKREAWLRVIDDMVYD
jgi:TolB-like protein